MKSILGYNDIISNNIFTYLFENKYTDLKVDELKSFIDIKKYFNYIWKDLENSQENHKFICYDKNNSEEFHQICQIILNNLLPVEYFEKTFEWGYFQGTNKQNKIFNEFTLINLINFYFTYKNYFWNNYSIFSKIEKTNFAVQYLYDFDTLITQIDTIFLELFNEFPIQFKNIDFYSIKIKFIKNLDFYINNPTNIFVNNIELFFDVLEFKDGIYLLKYDKFVPNKSIENNWNYLESLKIKTTKYYKKTYKYSKNLEPFFWLDQIKKTLDVDENLEDFLIYFISIFYKNVNLLGKKRILYIHGKPNTKKTTLTAQVLINYYGIENIGLISKNKNFNLENLLNKEIAIFDEYEHSDLPIDTILKLFEGADIIVDQKFKKPVILKLIHLIIISNNKLKLKKNTDEKIKETIEARLKYIQFNEIELDPKNLNEINKKLKEEESLIILYCNKILHKKMKIKNNVNNLLKLIEPNRHKED